MCVYACCHCCCRCTTCFYSGRSEDEKEEANKKQQQCATTPAGSSTFSLSQVTQYCRKHSVGCVLFLSWFSAAPDRIYMIYYHKRSTSSIVRTTHCSVRESDTFGFWQRQDERAKAQRPHLCVPVRYQSFSTLVRCEKKTFKLNAKKK